MPLGSCEQELGSVAPAAGDAPGPGTEVAEITETVAFEAVQPAWDALYAQCPQASPFQSPEWLIAWRRHFLNEGLWMLAIRRAGHLIGLAPFFLFRDPADGQRQVTLLGNGISDRLDLLTLPNESDAVSRAVFGHLQRRRTLWDRCDFRDLPARSELKAGRLAIAAEDTLDAEEPCPIARLPAAPEEIADLLPRKRRDDLRRCARRAAETGRITYDTAEATNRAAFLAELMRLHELRWRRRGEAGVLADEKVRRFHRDVTAKLLDRGMLRLHLLRLDGRAIAAQYALQHRDTAYSYLIAFDPDYAHLSPGLLLTAFTLAEAVRDGAKAFDFLRGREGYKYLWGAIDLPQFRRRLHR
jgi:CelD/BcsL family acetyltransferase involved in cellulose biosynthesis